MQDLALAYIQTDLAWEQPQANRDHLEELISRISPNQDLIVLPETFTTGFPVDPALFAEEAGGPSMDWMAKMASTTQAVITGSILLKTKKGFQNTLVWMRPDGQYQTYAKRHVFRMGGEHELIQPGDTHLLVELKDWKIRPLICYDLRFPVWSKNSYKNDEFGYDLLIYVANWPAVRSYPWNQLLIARAIENMTFVLGVNRIGADIKGIAYDGHSQLISPKGLILSQAVAKKEAVIESVLKKADLVNLRNKFNVGPDWDAFDLLMDK